MLAFAALLVGGAACGANGGNEADAPATTVGAPFDIDACQLLATGDLESEFDVPFAAGNASRHEGSGAFECRWLSTNTGTVRTVILTVYIDGALDESYDARGATVQALFEDERDVARIDEELDIADQAYRAGSTIAVLDGPVSFTLYTYVDDQHAVDGLTTLARQLVETPIVE